MDQPRTLFEIAIDELMLAVSDAANAVWRKYPFLTAKEVETAIEGTVRPLGNDRDDEAKYVFQIAREEKDAQ